MLSFSPCSGYLLQSFAPLFDARVGSYARLLLFGAMLAPGKRTVTAVLRIVGGGNERNFQNYHRALNRARWNSRAASRLLLGLLIQTFVPSGPILVGLDDTIERRWGRKIQSRDRSRMARILKPVPLGAGVTLLFHLIELIDSIRQRLFYRDTRDWSTNALPGCLGGHLLR